VRRSRMMEFPIRHSAASKLSIKLELPLYGSIILTEITGVQFSNAWEKRVSGSFFSVPVHFISLEDLIANKSAVGRSSDIEHWKKSKNDLTPNRQFGQKYLSKGVILLKPAELDALANSPEHQEKLEEAHIYFVCQRQRIRIVE